MNLKDQMHDLPPDLATDGLVPGVQRRRRRQQAMRAGLATTAVAAVALGGVFVLPQVLHSKGVAEEAARESAAQETNAVSDNAEAEEAAAEGTAEAVESDDAVVVAGEMLLDGKGGTPDWTQRDDSTPVRMCQAHMQSSPPQCAESSPTIIGEIDWELLETDDFTADAWVVGIFDNAQRTLTLTSPPTLERPPGAVELVRPEWDYAGERSPEARAAVTAIVDGEFSGNVELASTIAGNDIEINAFYADDALMERIHAATDPHIARENVHVLSYLQPLED